MDMIDRRLLDEYQHDLPLDPRPFAAIGRQLGIAEDEVIARLDRLRQHGTVSRVGAVVRPNVAGASTLAAMAVPPEWLERVAALVTDYPCVDRAGIDMVLADISRRTGLQVLDLPMLEDFHIDLGFGLQWT